jgi:hypothetical protein
MHATDITHATIGGGLIGLTWHGRRRPGAMLSAAFDTDQRIVRKIQTRCRARARPAPAERAV